MLQGKLSNKQKYDMSKLINTTGNDR